MQILTLSARGATAGYAGIAVPAGTAPPPPRLRSARRNGGGRLAFVAFAACALAAFGGVLSLLASRAAADREAMAAAVPVRPTWVDVNAPIHLYDLSGSEFGRLPLDYRARRREPTGERQDLLTYGTAGSNQPFLALAILRRGESAPAPVDFFVSMARVGGEAGLAVTRTALPTLLPSRFGAFAVADVVLAAASGPLPCLGFRLQGADPAAPVDIAGLACRKDFDRVALGCVLDRIDLVSAGEDDALRDFFVEAERRRQPSCGVSPLLAAGSHASWLDGSGPPAFLRRQTGTRSR